MANKFYDFLNSIGIDNVDDFDICFYKTYKQNQVFVFELLKKSPWTYDLLNYFIEHLNNIQNYEYKLKFVYEKEISGVDVFNLFTSIYETYFGIPFQLKYEISSNLIILKNEDVKLNGLLNDFYSLLNFISYPNYRVLIEKNLNELEENLNGNSNDFDDSVDEITDIDVEDNSNLNNEDFDFEEEITNLVNEQSNIIKERNEYLSKKLEGLDQSQRYYEESIDSINNADEKVFCEAEIFSIEKKEIRGGRYRYIIGVHHELECIYLCAITGKTFKEEFLDEFKVGDSIAFTGYSYVDKYSNNDIAIQLTSIKKINGKVQRTDLSEEKRVELHLHTKMSNMDAVGTIDAYCKLASSMGHKAIAITDHGVVQGFPNAQAAAKKYNIKMLYGSELYVVEDHFIGAYNPTDEKLNDITYVVFDLETTGLSIRYDKIIEFGAVKVKNGIVLDRLDILINPRMKLPKKIIEITNITDEELERKPTIENVIDKIMDFIGDCTLVSHNLEFDYGFLNEALIKTRRKKLVVPAIDTLALSRYLNPEVNNHRLGSLCRRVDVFYDEDSAHRADYDAEVLSKVWSALSYTLIDKELTTLKSIERLEKQTMHIKHSREMHTTVIAKNANGLKSLYKLISLSHIEFLGRYPCVPRSKLMEFRDDLIIGSACFNGEVFDSAARLSEESLDSIVQFYDFIEIQPLGNYSHLINMGSNGIEDIDKLKRTLFDIINSANKFNKLICATGDVHYVNPEDKVFRDVYIYSSGVGKTSHPLYPIGRSKMEDKGIYFENPNQHYRSTDEMMDEFKIYGLDNAYNWVIKNPNIIADMCDVLYPIKDKLYTPTIDNCENMLKELCFNNAHNLYGEDLPSLIEERLTKELDGIINNGYSVIYYIAHRIIKKAHEDGFIVGSRGSVGSSFVATMANITEVNPLPPHYRCPKCKHFELYEGKEYFSGYDLPKKKCPICGEELIGDGQNIPFETFLGFNADKVPDIDLNFPPDYQSKAHDYTKVLLGEENVFRAGTIGTVAEKTAFGYAKGYFEKKYRIDASTVSKAKLSYLAIGCQDVKRTTGQHPGGIVVIPRNFEVYDFTPIQFPADDMDAEWKTTHFDFHAIHDTVLKLDLLGHVDPQALKFMCDFMNINYLKIPLTDQKVLSIFSSPKELNLSKNYLKLTNGALALPEFGTEFVRGMLDSTKPSSFSDLVIISGLSHGTNVWRNNADELISSNITNLRGVIGCRDDIMTYLISMGIPSIKAFAIMEDVRKGRSLKEEYVELLRANNVPEYYIDSCNKIKYLFPKAHATAYVTMAIRVGWFKVYHPLVFYAGFFSVRCDKYEWNTMYEGPKSILKRLDELDRLKKEKPNDYSKKYEEIEKTLTVSLEMYDRGYKFANIDLYKSDDKNFIIDESTKSLIPPFKVVDGLGETAALNIIEARKCGEFSSIEDLVKRSKMNNTQLDLFRSMGILDGLNEKDIEQLSLFDF